MKKFVLLFSLSWTFVANAQWAVYDHEVFQQVEKINNIKQLEKDFNELNATYKSELNNDTSRPQDLTLGDGDNKAVMKGIDTQFDKLDDLTPEDKAKYIGTMEDCGSDKNKEASEMYKSCIGLRNFRIQTLKSTQQAFLMNGLASNNSLLIRRVL